MTKQTPNSIVVKLKRFFLELLVVALCHFMVDKVLQLRLVPCVNS
jgi:hypothetical protein